MHHTPRRWPAILACACMLLPFSGSHLRAQTTPAQDDDMAPIDAANAAHNIKTVFLIVMENHNWTGNGSQSIKGNSAAPYINHTLLPMASHAENYQNPPGIHPSLPNYLWLEAGTNFGIRNDNGPNADSQGTHEHLATLLDHAGVTWKSFDENATANTCPVSNEGAHDSNGDQLYAVRHNPFVYFDDITGNRNPHSAACIAHIRPFTEFQHDLQANTVARYNFITPNICDDMHDSCGGNPIAHGDAWLSRVVPEILRSTAYRNNGALFITWDEAGRGDGPIGMIVLSPLAKGNGYSSHLHYTHGSTLRTIEEIFGISPLIRDAAHQRDLRDLFRVFP